MLAMDMEECEQKQQSITRSVGLK